MQTFASIIADTFQNFRNYWHFTFLNSCTTALIISSPFNLITSRRSFFAAFVHLILYSVRRRPLLHVTRVSSDIAVSVLRDEHLKTFIFIAVTTHVIVLLSI